ncbi:spore gernimation protein GerC [Paenibacillus sp. IHB B 3415]|uniref:Ger(x)C family spore germination protein n=1 Tax=Paenibacillus sp. IHB B 3415 TaxID=867080 RepID=UPI000573D364|nr:Ger(x)C family spore germination protein [Paenibacillus sp. IHB B 3415]KHL95984.1 spore gernimation protein GerC [Paenibacillus sp. IHB B 3415]
MWGRRALTLLLVLCLASLTGCWSRKELNDLALVMALGIDLDPEGYAVSAQIMNPSETGTQKGSSGSLPVVTYKCVGRTVPEALQRMLSVAPRIPYLAHIRVLVVGEALARSGVSDALDFISRDHQLRNDFYLLVAKNRKAADILEILIPFEHIPANSLYSSILVAHKKWAATGKVTLQQFITELERGGSNPIMSGVQLQGDVEEGDSPRNVQSIRPKTLIQHAGIAVFKKDKLVGWLDETLSKSVNYVLADVDTTVGNITSPGGGTVGFTVSRADTSLDIRLNDQDQPEFLVKLNIEADLTTVEGTLDLNKPSSIQAIEEALQNKYNIKMARDIRTIQQQYNSDIFGFGEALHRKYPHLWKDYREHWEDSFQTVKIDVQSKVTVRRIGSVIQPLKREIEEK